MGVRQRVILLTGGHRQSNDNNSSSSMGFYPSGSGIGDAAAAGSGFLFAVHYNSGPGTFFSSSGSYQGVLGASPCAYHGVTESDIFSFSGNVGLDLCWLEDAWNTAIETVRATALVLLLGTGGFLCYRLYTRHKEDIVAAIYSIILEPIAAQQEDKEEQIEERERKSVQTNVGDNDEDLFAGEDLFEVDITLGLNCLLADNQRKWKVRKGSYIANQIKTRWRHVAMRKPCQVASVSNELVFVPTRCRFSTPESRSCDVSPYLVRQGSESDLSDGLESLLSQGSPSYNQVRSYSFFPVMENGTLRWNTGSRDSVISVGADVSEVSRLIRECSLSSDESDLSLSIHEEHGLSTIQVMERIEAEVNSIKDNCLEMNQEIVTLHTDQPTAFKDLLSITNIVDDSSDSVDSIDSSSEVSLGKAPVRCLPLDLASPCYDGASLEWDNEGMFVRSPSGITIRLDSVPESSQNPAPVSRSLIESGFLEWDRGSTSLKTDSGESPMAKSRSRDSVDLLSCTTSFSSCLASPQEEEEPSSGVKRRQWATTSQSNRDSAVYDIGVDVESAWNEEAIGPCIDLSAFAESTWQAPTPRAYAIKQAFVEVEHMTGCKSMRRMRGDHYGILRAALFQMVMKRLPVPRADHAIECISRDMQRGNLWVREWTFGHRLPYGAENVMQGICQCLSSLDQLMDELSEENDPTEVLLCRLNADNLLDTRLMEGLKLHVLSAALSLELSSTLDDALPLFALALFARKDSKNTKDLALNYLNAVGDSTTLEKAEFYLLGYALGVRLDVYRPTAISLDKDENSVDLRTSYPDWESFSDFISVIEEDDRHYSVPMP